MRYDIHNPTPAARVIYDGIAPQEAIEGRGRQREIYIASGDTKHGIELADDIAQDLIARTRAKTDHDKDLRLTPSADQDQPKQAEQPKQPEQPKQAEQPTPPSPSKQAEKPVLGLKK